MSSRITTKLRKAIQKAQKQQYHSYHICSDCNGERERVRKKKLWKMYGHLNMVGNNNAVVINIKCVVWCG